MMSQTIRLILVNWMYAMNWVSGLPVGGIYSSNLHTPGGDAGNIRTFGQKMVIIICTFCANIDKI